MLDFVASSHCTFIRNGSEYTAADARKHMQRKLDYLSRRDMIDTTEDFIERAASESSFSGKPYKVRCDGREQLSGDWLRDELQVLRQVAH
ncbi:hypothetical protein EYV96_10120 [Dyella terrae]|uniref:Uncharacterized protein n=2 Tax=Dyella TaxID=231454 RepID=A0A4R0Z287_9GAMM|nr:hypothetical protein EYV96_10120 [Dyella terrae]TCI13744.1 hypothetical protein EZM97_00750 [Dyella soli]